MSRVFRGKFISLLKEAYHKKKLYLENSLDHLQDPRDFEHLISRAAAKDWVVYAKRPFSSPEVVLKYLANYTHRIGISNYRLRAIDETTVTFSARHKTHKGKKRTVQISHEDFVQRFMLHVIPKKFRRIRYFGFLAPRSKNTYLTAIRSELKAPAPPKEVLSPKTCPECKKGLLKLDQPFKSFKPHRKHPKFPFELPFLPPQTSISCLSPPI